MCLFVLIIFNCLIKYMNYLFILNVFVCIFYNYITYCFIFNVHLLFVVIFYVFIYLFILHVFIYKKNTLMCFKCIYLF